MVVSIEMEFPSFAEAGRARVLFETRAEILQAAGVVIAGVKVTLVLGVSKTAFALKLGLQVLTEIAIGAAGNAVYDQLKAAVSEIEATKPPGPPAIMVSVNDQRMVLEQQPFLRAFEAAHAPTPHGRKAQR